MFHLALPVPLLPLTYQRPALPLFLKLPRESQEQGGPRAANPCLFFKGDKSPLGG